MRTAIRKEIEQIVPFDDLEKTSKRNALSWIDSGVEICRLAKPATPPKHLVSYFVVVDDNYILLVDHIAAELWLPSGGHVEPGEHPKDTASREAREELSIEANFLQETPVLITITETVGKTAGHTDVSLWYVLRANRSEELNFDQSEFSRVQWFHKDELPFDRTEPHMRRFLKKFYG